MCKIMHVSAYYDEFEAKAAGYIKTIHIVTLYPCTDMTWSGRSCHI